MAYNNAGGGRIQNHPFPLDRFPIEFREAVENFHYKTGVSIPAVASVVLGALSIACQSRIRVRKNAASESPVTIWTLVALESGERKTTLLNLVMKVLREYETALSQTAEKARLEFEAQQTLYKAKKRRIKSLMDEVIKNGEAPDGLLKLHMEISQGEPTMPAVRRLIHEDVSSGALLENMAKHSASTSIVTDEFGFFVSGRALSRIALLCKAHDGSDITSDRKSEDTLRIKKPLVTMVLLGQNGVIDDFVKKHYQQLDESGFLSRFLIPVCESHVGYRTQAQARPVNPAALDAFDRKISSLLQASENGLDEDKPKVLAFDFDAQRRWDAYYDRVEIDMRDGRYYSRFRPLASRLADKVARVAAILHYAYDGSGDIPYCQMESAIAIVDWYAQSYVSIFGFQSMKVEDRNAILLAQFLVRRVGWSYGIYNINRSYLLQRAPTPLRRAGVLGATIDYLISQGCMQEGVDVFGKPIVVAYYNNLSNFLNARLNCT